MSTNTAPCGCTVETSGLTRRVKHRAACTVQAKRVANREASLTEMTSHPDPRFAEAAKRALEHSQAQQD